MLDIQIDESAVRALMLQKLDEKLQEVDAEMVFWDTNELKRRTCLSWNTILDKFFYDPRFPKFKVGTKWVFPAKETQKFLLTWLTEQPRS